MPSIPSPREIWSAFAAMFKTGSGWTAILGMVAFGLLSLVLMMEGRFSFLDMLLADAGILLVGWNTIRARWAQAKSDNLLLTIKNEVTRRS